MLHLGVGPSRLALRNLSARSLSTASTASTAAARPALVFARPAHPAGLASLRLLSTTPSVRAAPPRRKAQGPRPVRDQLSETEWPWRPLGNGEEERVIFARPVTTDPRMMWVFAVLWLGGVVTWVVMPSDRETSAYMAQQFPDAPKADDW